MEIGGLKCMAQKAEAYGMNDQECRWSHCGEGGGHTKLSTGKSTAHESAAFLDDCNAII